MILRSFFFFSSLFYSPFSFLFELNFWIYENTSENERTFPLFPFYFLEALVEKCNEEEKELFV